MTESYKEGSTRDFQKALKRLVEDEDYRAAVIEDWTRLTNDFGELNTQELMLLVQVWNATGPDETRLSWFLCHCCTSRV